MSMMQEFKDFAVKGNLVDMAVGIIMGAAFGKVVSSFVKDVVMPPIGKLLGGVDFGQLIVDLSGDGHASLAAATAAGAPAIAYGTFIQAVVDFLIIAMVVFLAVKVYNNIKKKEEAKPAAPAADIVLLTEIRDALKK